MKQFLLFTCLLTAALLNAQDNNRYLTGAVPVENGKVVFTQTFEDTSRSKTEWFALVQAWLQERAIDTDNRLVFTDKDAGTLAFTGKSYLIFASTALSLDRALLSYQIVAECSDRHCTLQFGRIKYEYNVSYQQEPERYTAEEWITDEVAIYKGKLLRIPGKFRTKTIDFVDQTFDDFSRKTGKQTQVHAETAPTPQAPVTPPPPAIQQTPPSATREGFVAIASGQLPTTILNMLPDCLAELTVADRKDIPAAEIVWKGTGTMMGKMVAQIALPGNNAAAQAIGDGEVFTLSFLKKTGDSAPWLIMECRKIGGTTEGSQQTIIGEISQAWIK